MSFKQCKTDDDVEGDVEDDGVIYEMINLNFTLSQVEAKCLKMDFVAPQRNSFLHWDEFKVTTSW